MSALHYTIKIGKEKPLTSSASGEVNGFGNLLDPPSKPRRTHVELDECPSKCGTSKTHGAQQLEGGLACVGSVDDDEGGQHGRE